VRPVFADEQLERSLTERGYAVVDMLGSGDVTALLDLHARALGDPAEGVQRLMQFGNDARDVVRDEITDAYERRLAPRLSDHRPMGGGIIAKAPAGESAIRPHLDWCFVDETRHRSVNLWVPLCDTTHANGALAVVPGSHRLRHTIRGSGTPSHLVAATDVVAQQLEVVPMKAGQALLFDHRLIHGSSTNTSARPRIALALPLVPAEVAPVHYVGDSDAPEAPVRQVEVDQEFWHEHRVDPSIGRDPNIESLIAGRPTHLVPPTPPITTEDVRSLAPSAGGRLSRLLRRHPR
jgi:hypothetical protein